MQQRNFVLFMVLSFVILLGWMYVREQVWPTKKADPIDQTHANPPSLKAATPDQVCQWFVSAVPQPDGLGTALRLMTATVLAKEHAPTLYAQKKALRDRILQKQALPALTRLAGSLPGIFDAFAPVMVRGLLAARANPGRSTEPARVFTLGDDSSFLRAVITTRGGGIRRLTLTKFQEATEEGRPAFAVKDGKKVKEQLDLIPDDPFQASFLIYHYSDKETPQTTLGEATWHADPVVKQDDEWKLVLWFDEIPGYKGVKIKRIYTLKPKDYHVGLEVEVKDNREAGAARELPFKYQMAGAHGLPIEGEWYSPNPRTPLIGILNARGELWRDLDETQHRISQRDGGELIQPSQPSFIQYVGGFNQFFASVTVVDNKQANPEDGGVEPRNVVDYARPTLESREKKGKIQRVSLKDGEIEVMGTDPAKEPGRWTFKLLPRARKQIEENDLKPGEDVLVSCYESPTDGWIATELHKGKNYRPHLDDFTVRVVSPPLNLKPGEKVVHRYLLYNGPAKVRLLGYFRGDEAVDPELVARYSDTLHLRTITDYRSAGFMGTISQTIYFTDLLIQTTRLMHWLLDKIHLVLPQWGLVIVALTVLVRGLMFPISRRQALISMRMQALAPEMAKLKEKFKSDPQAQQKAIMELYRKHHINPLGGCLPLVLQMPIFLGLYYCLQESIFFRLASFAWIENLAAPDMLFGWGQNIPWISDPDSMGSIFYLGPYFNLLPIIAVSLMLVQQKLMSPPAVSDEQVMQQKMMKYMMIVMAVMFYKVAAGLCIYFIASSLWGLAEKKLLPKSKTAPQAGEPALTEEKKAELPLNAKQRRRIRERERGKPRVEEPDTAVQKVKGWWQEVLKQAKKK